MCVELGPEEIITDEEMVEAIDLICDGLTYEEDVLAGMADIEGDYTCNCESNCEPMTIIGDDAVDFIKLMSAFSRYWPTLMRANDGPDDRPDDRPPRERM